MLMNFCCLYGKPLIFSLVSYWLLDYIDIFLHLGVTELFFDTF